MERLKTVGKFLAPTGLALLVAVLAWLTLDARKTMSGFIVHQSPVRHYIWQDIVVLHNLWALEEARQKAASEVPKP